MKLYLNFDISVWTIHVIPCVSLYFDAHSPHVHSRLFRDGISGLYFSLSWLKWTLTFGIHKTIK
jgi:hypothetical protein